MRNDFDEQLDQVENAFLKEKSDILYRNEVEIKMLFNKHKKLEDEYQDKRQKQEENCKNQLEMLKT